MNTNVLTNTGVHRSVQKVYKQVLTDTHYLRRLLPLNMSCIIDTVCCSVTFYVYYLLLLLHILVVAVVSLLCCFQQVLKQICSVFSLYSSSPLFFPSPLP